MDAPLLTSAVQERSSSRWTELVTTSALVVLVVCSLVALSVIVRREVRANVPPTTPVGVTAVSDWRLYADSGRWTGAPGAPVVITVFTDLQCPGCRIFDQLLDTLQAKYASKVAVVFRHFPLTTVHPLALSAAVATECAARQGKFDAYRRLVYENQALLTADAWTPIALKAGVADTKQFRRCVDTKATLARVEADIRAGVRLQVEGTPTVLVNGRRFRRSPRYATLDALVRHLVETVPQR